MPRQRTTPAICPVCGGEFFAYSHQIKGGKTPYCSRPCYLTTSVTRMPEYTSWQSMRDRCRNPNAPRFDRYGGRGITICPEWDSFEQFRTDMGPRPGPEYTIERIDNDGPYAAWNCRWATRGEQMQNTRQNVRLTYQGRTQIVAEWARETGIPIGTISSRLKRNYPIERILDPVRKRTGRPPKK